jgi:hypothetical protein
MPWLGEVVRADLITRQPMVLTRDEIGALPCVSGCS